MSSISYGDLASSLTNMRRTTQVKLDLERYNYEVSSGQKSDLRTAVSGDFTPLASLERSLRSLGAYETSIGEAELFASSLQSVLGTVSDHISSLSTDLFTVSEGAQPVTISIAANDARGKLDSVISVLNTRVGGRSLLSGAATGTTALASADDMMAQIGAIVATQVSAGGIIAAVDDWFDAPSGGFETSGFLGSQNNVSPFMLNENERASLDIKADDQSIRDTLKGLVLASLVDEQVMAGNPDEQVALLQEAGSKLLASDAAITVSRAHVGRVEQQIDEARMANSAEGYALELAKSKIVSADVYESAAMLTQAQSQLEMIYTLTARLSQLKLSDYL